MQTLALSVLGILLVSCNSKKSPQVGNWGEPTAEPVDVAAQTAEEKSWLGLDLQGAVQVDHKPLVVPLPELPMVPVVIKQQDYHVTQVVTTRVDPIQVQPAVKPYDSNAWKRDLACRQEAIRTRIEAEYQEKWRQ